jgi:hypothetical protein
MIFNNPAVDIYHVCFSPVLAIFVKINFAWVLFH